MTEETILSYRREVGVIFQDYKLLESKKVYENVAFAMEVCGYSDALIRKKVPEALEKV
jgi:cell division transport system ATP-binding protein